MDPLRGWHGFSFTVVFGIASNVRPDRMLVLSVWPNSIVREALGGETRGRFPILS